MYGNILFQESKHLKSLTGMAKKLYNIIYQDDSILVANKSTGITVIPTRNGIPKSLKEYLETELKQDLWTVHRIDKETSGIVIFANNEIAHRELSLQFQKRIVTKEYLCLTAGNGINEWKEINRPILVDSRSKTVSISRDGKKAISHYKCLENSKRYSKHLVKIETGRMHQIRIHMATVGHPILGDELYNRHHEVFLSTFKKKYTRGRQDKQERSLMLRSALHAYTLEIIHPETEEKMKFEAPLPKDIKACWNQISKWDV